MTTDEPFATAALLPGATVVVAPYEGRLPVSGTVLELDGLRVRVQRNDGWADWYDVSEVQVIDSDRYERRRRWKHRRTLLWGRTFYRPWQQLLHHFDLHHCRKMLPVEGRWRHVKCDWCGLHGRILIITPEDQLSANNAP